MKHNQKQFRWLLIAMVMIFSLVACQSTNETSIPEETDIPEEIDIPAETDATAVPTTEPYVLEGSTTTESGLQYLEIVAGDGSAPEADKMVTMHYTVSLPDGTELFSSYLTDQPATVIWGHDKLLPGWEEGVNLMKVGGKAKIVLPPELAFGEDGTSGVPPNSQLVMELELLSVEKPPTPATVSEKKLDEMTNGLQYYDLTAGKGTEAITDSIVTTDYTIWVQGEDDEYTFVASSQDGQPLTFVIGQGNMVFPGWEWGVLGMKAGGKRFLVIPPDLALGEQGNADIPPNSTLVMEIELVEIAEPQVATEVDEEDYTTTESGLKYYDLQKGTGDAPTEGQTVAVHYTGWLEDGTQFDSSIERGQPFTFVLGTGSVIAGWDEGVASMKVGGKRQLVIPADLGYGESGSGSIPPSATLIFEVELLEIQD